ncbi:hypothetical protein OIU79_009374 [Salix purpurea]|uniref:Uncharacterized protein n=1 Tax=Salix purpurea TaxID=77065 RepID=A0A9Q0YX54_SALPP|nr:hypothetical protein OIU79_009374 [Salix purpurea]
MNSFAIDQDISNLKRECEEKDATIKDLTGILQSNNMAGSKRIQELEDIVCRKNTMITRLRKDMMVLEQKTVRNIVYDMDSTASPSSSDSDSSPVNRPQVPSAKVEVTLIRIVQL